MQKEAYDQLREAEDIHWYHDLRRQLVNDYLGYVREDLGPDLNILDAGCGTGGMLGLLSKYGRVTGLEKSDYALNLCRQRLPQATLKNGSIEELDRIFTPETFDLICIFNVLYHKWISDDAAVLKQAFGVLKPGGYLIIVEPAFNCLYRDNDRFCHGARRYTKEKISKLQAEGGFCLKKSTYFNSFSFLPLLIFAQLERYGLIKHNEVFAELKSSSGYLNNFIKLIVPVERAWIKIFGKLPIGVSVLSLARKPVDPV